MEVIKTELWIRDPKDSQQGLKKLARLAQRFGGGEEGTHKYREKGREIKGAKGWVYVCAGKWHVHEVT